MAIKFLSDIDVTGSYNLQASDIPDISATYATVAWVTNQNFLTTLPAHNHDDRYYTKSQADGKYLLIGGETDPVFVAHPAYGVTAQKITNWDSAFGWGDHSGAGYLLKPVADSYYQPIGNYDNYSSWNLKTNSVQRTTVTSGGTLNLVAGTNVTVAYSAGGTVTISSSVPAEYLTQKDGDARYLQSLPAHTHPIEEVDGLQDVLDTKADAGHTHSYLPLAGGTMSGNIIFPATAGRGIYFGGETSGASYGFVREISDGQIEFGSDDSIKFYETDAMTLRADWSMNSGAFNFIGTISQSGANVATQAWVTSQNYLTAVPAGYATETYVTNAVSALVDSAPGTLNTLNELAAALGDDPNFATTITTAIGNKADVVHTHDINDINGLQDELDNKQPAGSYAASTHTHTFASLTSKPTTLSGYGITDAASSGHTHTFASLTSKPTTLSGYGITDAATAVQGAKADTALQSLPAHNHDSLYLAVRGSLGTSNDVGSTVGWANNLAGGTYDRNYVNHSGKVFVVHDGGGSVGQFAIESTYYGDTFIHANVDSVAWATKKIWTSYNFTSTNISNWNTAYDWGNHATAGYGSAGDTAKGVEAFGWGNHADAGYLTSVTNISGNAATATKLATARTISLSGDASGSATFDGSVNATISVTVADDSHNHTTLSALGDYVFNNATNGRSFPRGIQTSFVSDGQGYPNYGSVMRIATYSGLNDGGTAQLYFPYSPTYGGDTIKYKLGLYNNAGWSQWYNIASREWVTAQNYLTSLPAHTHTFASLTSKPTTLSGYGITDAATSGQGTKADTAYGWGDHSQQQYITQVQGDTLYQPIGNYAADVHTHSEYAPKASPTLTGTIHLNGETRLGDFSGNNADEWPKVYWYRDTPNGWDEGLIKASSTRGFFGKSHFGIHFDSSRAFGFFTSSWTKILGVESSQVYSGVNLVVNGTVTATGGNSTNWNTAYGWGNHASAGYATPADITTAINNLVDSAPGALNTLNELAAAIGDDANFATTITNSIATKLSLSGPANLSGMKRFETNFSTEDDWQNSPISVLERDAIGTGSTNNIYAPNLNFHWRNRISRSLWMDSTGGLHYGEYSGAGVPGENGTFYVGGGNSSQWNTAYSWGNHATAGYGSAGDTAKGVEAFGWGNHANAGYITDGNTNWDNIYGFITASSSITGNAATASMLIGSYSIGSQPGTNKLLYTGQISAGTTGLFATVDNSNSIITLNRHSGNYDSQLGFSSNGNIYYRKFSNSTAFLTQPWLQVWHSGNFADNSSNWNTAYGWGNHAVAGYATQAWVTAQGFASATGNATQAWVTANYQPVGSYAASTHQHDASDIVSGQFAAEQIPDLSGTYSLSSHSHSFSEITSKPTTLSGYGITDAASSSHTHSDFIKNNASGTLTGDFDLAPDNPFSWRFGTEQNQLKEVHTQQLFTYGYHESGLATEGIGEQPTGTVVVATENGLEPCNNLCNHMVMGVITHGHDSPVVMGAEPVLVTGEVKFGDYLVTSNKVGHAVAVSREYVVAHNLLDCCFAKALESGSGDSYIIKAMINKL